MPQVGRGAVSRATVEVCSYPAASMSMSTSQSTPLGPGQPLTCVPAPDGVLLARGRGKRRWPSCGTGHGPGLSNQPWDAASRHLPVTGAAPRHGSRSWAGVALGRPGSGRGGPDHLWNEVMPPRQQHSGWAPPGPQPATPMSGWSLSRLGCPIAPVCEEPGARLSPEALAPTLTLQACARITSPVMSVRPIY